MNKALGTMTLFLFALSTVAIPADEEKPPPPPPPPKATGELSDAERLFQGNWRLGGYGNDAFLGKLQIDGRDFHAKGVHGQHLGYVSIRGDKDPAEIDFTIEECGGCGFAGKTSAGIYYRDGEILIFSGPVPGEPRSKDFSNQNELWRMRRWDDAAEQEEKKRAEGG